MNISVYLPDRLKNRLDSFTKDRDMTTNSAIRKAIELLLRKEKDRKWGDWINQLEPDPDFPDIEDIRNDLKLPKENLF